MNIRDMICDSHPPTESRGWDRCKETGTIVVVSADVQEIRVKTPPERHLQPLKGMKMAASPAAKRLHTDSRDVRNKSTEIARNLERKDPSLAPLKNLLKKTLDTGTNAAEPATGLLTLQTIAQFFYESGSEKPSQNSSASVKYVKADSVCFNTEPGAGYQGLKVATDERVSNKSRVRDRTAVGNANSAKKKQAQSYEKSKSIHVRKADVPAVKKQKIGSKVVAMKRSKPPARDEAVEMAKPNSSPNYRGRCKYKTGKCMNERALKVNGMSHNLCEFHRAKQNSNQRKLDRKLRDKRLPIVPDLLDLKKKQKFEHLRAIAPRDPNNIIHA